MCVFCMKYETSDFLANPLICLKQCRHNGNCPHIFPLKVTKGREGELVIEKHMLSQLSHKCHAARHALTPLFAGKIVIFTLVLTAGCLPAHALPPKRFGLCVYGREGHGCACACAGACSEHKETQACPFLFCRLPLLD